MASGSTDSITEVGVLWHRHRLLEALALLSAFSTTSELRSHAAFVRSVSGTEDFHSCETTYEYL